MATYKRLRGSIFEIAIITVAVALWQVALAVATCPEVCLDVTQGSRFFGRFPPIKTKTDVVEFYNYKHYSFNGDDVVPLLIDQSLLMVHQYDDDDTCELSVVIVHDSKDDATGGQAHMLVSGNNEVPLVQDGPGDGSKSDLYRYVPDLDATEMFWEWGWLDTVGKKYRTDGMANKWESSDTKCLDVRAKFIFGIDAWRFVPGILYEDTGSVPFKEYLYLDKDDTVSICKVDCDEKYIKWGH